MHTKTQTGTSYIREVFERSLNGNSDEAFIAGVFLELDEDDQVALLAEYEKDKRAYAQRIHRIIKKHTKN